MLNRELIGREASPSDGVLDRLLRGESATSTRKSSGASDATLRAILTNSFDGQADHGKHLR
jgi:hypothetical protein